MGFDSRLVESGGGNSEMSRCDCAPKDECRQLRETGRAGGLRRSLWTRKSK